MSVYQAMRGLSNVPWFYPLANMRPIATPFFGSAAATASATAHTKGAWAQLIASTAAEAGLMMIRAESVSTAATETSMLLDIGVGASGSETPIMENLAIGGASASSSASNGLLAPLPVRIPSGSRVSCRIQALIPSDTCTVSATLFAVNARQMLPTSVDVIGTDTATSRGTAFAGALNAWTQITASTSQRYRALFAVPSVIGTDIISFNRDLEIAIGPAGSEVEIGRVYVDFRNTESVFHDSRFFYAPIACDIPAGSRLSVRTPVSANPDRYGVCLVGIP
jgi:hypothetical protein